MRRNRFAIKAFLFLSLTACGDSREEFSGNYGFTGEFKVGHGANQETLRAQGQLDVIADHFDDERLFLNWDCGMNGKMEDETMTLVRKNCPPFRSADCVLTYKYDVGNANIDGKTLKFTTTGTVAVRCDDGAAGSAPFTLTLEGERGKMMPIPMPGQQDLGGEPGPAAFHDSGLRDALLRSIQPSPGGE
ncbi:hypothetical protein HPC49_51805 [Pyxidicoccus fallax]|uniref:Uncharacterized protein n=1 Tax=Pyxidicoccus fallax TaxID=394095 RepID=A0A848LTI2_9BACT|nr:hypothetical protein [Pyxidicoccus fallax]NMO20704.1 hypothetical protein [Pyxidicoccus fallax]NPC86659.1 hypothetical protein [Pyxidicoccus fallax]